MGNERGSCASSMPSKRCGIGGGEGGEGGGEGDGGGGDGGGEGDGRMRCWREPPWRDAVQTGPLGGGRATKEVWARAGRHAVLQ